MVALRYAHRKELDAAAAAHATQMTTAAENHRIALENAVAVHEGEVAALRNALSITKKRTGEHNDKLKLENIALMNRAWELEAATAQQQTSTDSETIECGTQTANVSVHSDLARAEAVMKENALLWQELTDSMAERSQLRSVNVTDEVMSTEEMQCMAVSMDGTMATGGKECLALWNKNGAVTARASVDGQVFCVTFSDDGNMLAAGCSWQRVHGYVVV
jgi:hypothetical protein